MAKMLDKVPSRPKQEHSSLISHFYSDSTTQLISEWFFPKHVRLTRETCETVRNDKKSWDWRQNRESWQVCEGVCLIEVSLYMIHVGTYMERRGDPLIIMYTWSGEKGVYGRGYID